MFGCPAMAFGKFFQILMSSDFATNSRKRYRSMIDSLNNCSKYKNEQFSSRKQSNSSDYTHLALFYLHSKSGRSVLALNWVVSVSKYSPIF